MDPIEGLKQKEAPTNEKPVQSGQFDFLEDAKNTSDSIFSFDDLGKENFDLSPDSMDIPPQDVEPIETEKTGSSEAGKRKAYEKGAKMYVNNLDHLTKMLCSAITGKDRSRYAMDKDEKEAYIETSADFFETMNFNPSPATMWVTMTLMVLGGSASTAYMDYREEKQKEKNKENARIAEKRLQQSREQYEALEAEAEQELQVMLSRNHIPGSEASTRGLPIQLPKIYEPKRKRYDIDKDGYFRRSEDGVYYKTAKVPQAERERPHPTLLTFIRKLKDEGAKIKEINERCIQLIKSNPELQK